MAAAGKLSEVADHGSDRGPLEPVRRKQLLSRFEDRRFRAPAPFVARNVSVRRGHPITLRVLTVEPSTVYGC